MIRVPLPKRNDYFMINYLINARKAINYIITGITKEEEEKIDKEKPIIIERGEFKFLIGPEDIVVYGEVDLNTNSDDYKQLDNSKLLDNKVSLGVCIPASYNYEKHTGCKLIGHKYLQWVDTTSPAKVAQYAHGFLGKPDRIVIFRKSVIAKYDRVGRCYNDD